MNNDEPIEAAVCAAVDYELRGHDTMSKKMVKVADALAAAGAERDAALAVIAGAKAALNEPLHLRYAGKENGRALHVMNMQRVAIDILDRAISWPPTPQETWYNEKGK